MLNFTPGSCTYPHPPERCRWDSSGGFQSLTSLLCFPFLLTLFLSSSVGFCTGSSPVRKICSSIGSPQVAVPSKIPICSGVLCGLQGWSALPWRTSSFLLSWHSLSCFLLLLFPLSFSLWLFLPFLKISFCSADEFSCVLPRSPWQSCRNCLCPAQGSPPPHPTKGTLLPPSLPKPCKCTQHT